jgi:ribonuclease HI
LNYYWNIGKDTNNKAEVYALLKGLHLENQSQIQNLNVVGDSKVIIRMMIQGSEPKNLSLKRVIDRIHLLTRTLKTNFFHVLRCNNEEVDKMANLAIGKPPRTLGVEDEEGLAPLFNDHPQDLEPMHKGVRDTWCSIARLGRRRRNWQEL